MGNPVKDAARSVLMHPEPKLNVRAAQFLGGLMFSDLAPYRRARDEFLRRVALHTGLTVGVVEV